MTSADFASSRIGPSFSIRLLFWVTKIPQCRRDFWNEADPSDAPMLPRRIMWGNERPALSIIGPAHVGHEAGGENVIVAVMKPRVASI